MRRTLGFKARKYSIRGIFFTFLFAKRLIVGLYHLMIRFKREATEQMGECPKCHSLNLDYENTSATSTCVTMYFTCKNCKAKGKEIYGLEYIKSEIERLQNDLDGTQRFEGYSDPLDSTSSKG